ncbi:heme biosynthesis protein HemY [Methylobacterium nodulans]|uniref:HemY domain protein n=1 Tax=Methylobacterium nodulans (strain LMG 21967 / CNCM I-2342 / ORS 2060) TaxID=460265 RepID=B8IBT4_METNO|nr:heme biosynthesis HemY N-terminal domain-containing protein [Methylobacterium nodulans]ACL59338.1 HemY domain protein [Methylobacterium nodulans ORS 2060]
MWRALAFLALLAIAAYGAVWLADHPGVVTVTWSGYEVATSLAAALVGVLIFAVILGFVWAFTRGILRFPHRLRVRNRARRRARGYEALSRGMVAVGSGDPAAARRHAGEAARLLGDEPLALLLKAQAAQISGDRAGAENAFRRMTEEPETRVLGLRGLFVEARRQGDEATARAYAAEAARLAPGVSWANEAVLEAQCADRDWNNALETVSRRASLGIADKTAARRQRAVLLTASALELEAGDPERALAQAREAVKLAPDLVPAAAVAGRLFARRADLKRAARVVEAAWKASPHPDLARVYLDLRPGDSSRDRLARAETLARLSSWHPESRFAIARAALEAREFGRARDVLSPLLADNPTQRVYLMMAEIEEAEHGRGSGRAREWLARAAHAPRDPAWCADGIVSDRWAPVSPVSGRLDAFVWQTPPELLGRSSREVPPEEKEVSEPGPLPAPGPAVKEEKPAHPAGNGLDTSAPPFVATATPVVFPPPKPKEDEAPVPAPEPSRRAG